MAKGKHKPAPGAVRPDKVLHPQSRKVKKLHGKETRRHKLSSNVGTGGKRLQQLGEYEGGRLVRINIFKPNSPIVSLNEVE